MSPPPYRWHSLGALTLLFLLLTGADFHRYSPSEQVINGVRYPRTGQTLYRGTTDAQMSLSKALRAMLGDETAALESFLFSSVQQKLDDPRASTQAPIPEEIQGKLREKGRNLSKPGCDVHTASRQLIDELFDQYDRTGQSIARYIDYRSAQYEDWPRDIVFTSLISPVAATYGPNIVVIREKKPRSVDMNFWNKIHNGTWYDHKRDAGEMAAPGYIPAGDIDGFQLRTGREKGWHSIQTAFYRTEVDGKPAVLVLDGQGRSCIDRRSDGKIVFCHYRPGSIALEPPPLTDEEVPVLGLVRLCERSAECSRYPASLKTRHGKTSAAPLDAAVRRQLEETQVKGLRPKWIPVSE